MTGDRSYLCIDLKSFYASVECRERGLNPLDALLLVADESRTDKTICLAVSPALKKYGVPGRPRLFEAKHIIEERNRAQSGAESSCFASELAENPTLRIGFMIAKPRMSLYMDYSLRIFNIYRRFVSDEDIHVYSVDEVFIDLTAYLSAYQSTPRELAMRMIRSVLSETGITATAGIGTNLYLAKVAMDILAKKMPSDQDGVRIAELDEMSYREKLWLHTPLTDFWRVGNGTAEKLYQYGMYTMGDVARCSLGKAGDKLNEQFLRKLFGVNAELLIDHAWGWEPTTIKDIKAYKPRSQSISMGQVLSFPYEYEKAGIVVREMAEQLALSLVEKGVYTDQVILDIGFDTQNLSSGTYTGPVEADYYGKNVPPPVHAGAHLNRYTASSRLIVDAVMRLFGEHVPDKLLVRRIRLCAGHLSTSPSLAMKPKQLSLFESAEEETGALQREEQYLEKEHRRQKTIIDIRGRFGKNAIMMGCSLQDGSTFAERNNQVGGHKA